MLEQLLDHFPPHTHALTLVSDPDRLLTDEALERVLRARGFRLLSESDPVLFRHAYGQARPITVDCPVIVIIQGELNHAPYDIWQQAHPVELALYRLFPQLDYLIIKLLSPTQRGHLAVAVQQVPITRPLSLRATQDYLLANLFACDIVSLCTPTALVIWLADYHARADPMPTPLAAHLIQQLMVSPGLAGWPLADLINQAEHFYAFIQHDWQAYLAELSGQPVNSIDAPVLPFATDATLQDALPRFLRLGILKPTPLRRLAETPAWATPAIAYDASAARTNEIDEGLQAIAEHLRIAELRWSDWQTVARRWAKLTLLYYTSLHLEQEPLLHARFQQQQLTLNQMFANWLTEAYSPLAGHRLPDPHHLFHVPGYLATLRNRHARIALLVMDGMSLATWYQIKPVWQARHQDWQFAERLLLAQIPSITAISRQALISGLPPEKFADSLTTNRHEAKQWTRFWMQQGLAERSINYALLPNRREQPYPTQIDQPSMRMVCLVTPVIDDMVHGATQGLADVHASLAIWLDNHDAQSLGSASLEGLITHLLAEQYLVVIASDHGHVNAYGMGEPQEGVTVESRNKRARIYNNAQFASNVQSEYPNTILWHDDGLLPRDRWVLLPKTDQAFALRGQQVVSHGGLTIEEMVTPLVTIQRP